MWASTAQASPIWSRRNRLDRGSARSARQPGLLPISAPQARAHCANQVGAAPCRLGADDGPLISFPFPVLQSRSQSGSLQASVTGSHSCQAPRNQGEETKDLVNFQLGIRKWSRNTLWWKWLLPCRQGLTEDPPQSSDALGAVKTGITYGAPRGPTVGS